MLIFMVSLHAHVQGEYAFVQGELLWFVMLCFGGLLFALSHVFRGSFVCFFVLMHVFRGSL